MFLKQGNMPVNALLQEGFDMQYIGIFENPFETPDVAAHFTDRYLELPIVWPYDMPVGRFNSGATSIKIIQSCGLKPEEIEVDGLTTLLGPNDSLLKILLSEAPIDGHPAARLRIIYGRTYEDARVDDYRIANATKPALIN